MIENGQTAEQGKTRREIEHTFREIGLLAGETPDPYIRSFKLVDDPRVSISIVIDEDIIVTMTMKDLRRGQLLQVDVFGFSETGDDLFSFSQDCVNKNYKRLFCPPLMARWLESKGKISDPEGFVDPLRIDTSDIAEFVREKWEEVKSSRSRSMKGGRDSSQKEPFS